MRLDAATNAVLLAAGLTFLLALALGVWKYHGMARNENHLAHPYVDIAHRAALMYSFAILLLAVFVELSAFSQTVNLIAAFVPIAFFIGAIGSYMLHGALKDTDNQFRHPVRGLHAMMFALIVGEIGGTAVLVAGFAKAQIF